MKKALGLAALAFAGVVAAWAVLQLLFKNPDLPFLQACTRPLYLIPCFAVAAATAAATFVKARNAKGD